MSYIIDWICSGFSDTHSAVAQIIGFVPLILSFFVFLQKDRKKIIFFKTCSDCLWTIHFFVLGEVSGGAVNTVNTVRNIVFSQKEKKWAKSNVIPICFCAFTLLCALPGFEGVKSLFATVGSCLAIIGFWQTDVKKLRLFNLAAVTLWLVYGIWTVSIPTIISNILSVLSILSVFAKEKL